MSHACPECGAPLPDDVPSAPCSACLMKLGMKTWQEGAAGTERKLLPTQSYEPTPTTPSPQELAEYFPQLEILSLVGQGGMGAVFKAQQKSLDRTVALKLIRAESSLDEGFAERFVREAKSLAKLSHPNIVTVHDFGKTDKFYFFIMEFVDGANLRHLIQAKKMTPETALKIVPLVCDALQYAHDHGIVHRDIKPENILIDKSGNVKIADFGLAKLVNKDGTQSVLTQTHQVMGTMHYMAPEQIEKPLTVDHRADIYSLGVVIYEMLTGELPLGRFAPPSSKVRVDVRLDEVVLQSLEKEPELRFQNISQVKSQVESIKTTPPQVVPPKRQMQTAANQGAVHQAFESPLPHVPGAEAAYAVAPAKPPVAATMPAAPVERPGFFGALIHPRSWLNIAYLMLSFPLGIIYFVIMVTGFSTGFGLLIVWVGLFVLLGTLVTVRGFMMLERQMARSMLGASIDDRRPLTPPEGVWPRIKAMFTDSTTWTGVFYLFLKFPLGIASFVLTVTLLSTSIGLAGAVVVYKIPWVTLDIAAWRIDSMPEAVVISGAGVLLLFLSVHILNGFAWVHRYLAEGMLSPRPKAY